MGFSAGSTRRALRGGGLRCGNFLCRGCGWTANPVFRERNHAFDVDGRHVTTDAALLGRGVTAGRRQHRLRVTLGAARIVEPRLAGHGLVWVMAGHAIEALVGTLFQEAGRLEQPHRSKSGGVVRVRCEHDRVFVSPPMAFAAGQYGFFRGHRRPRSRSHRCIAEMRIELIVAPGTANAKHDIVDIQYTVAPWQFRSVALKTLISTMCVGR